MEFVRFLNAVEIPEHSLHPHSAKLPALLSRTETSPEQSAECGKAGEGECGRHRQIPETRS
jgi:hypothetical protein